MAQAEASRSDGRQHIVVVKLNMFSLIHKIEYTRPKFKRAGQTAIHMCDAQIECVLSLIHKIRYPLRYTQVSYLYLTYVIVLLIGLCELSST